MSRKIDENCDFLKNFQKKIFGPYRIKKPQKSNWRKLVKMGFLWTWAEKGSEKRKFGGIWKSMVKTYYGKNPQN